MTKRKLDAAEMLAYYAWRNAKPVTAMSHLARAGRDQAARRAFLVRVFGMTADAALDFSTDRYIADADESWDNPGNAFAV